MRSYDLSLEISEIAPGKGKKVLAAIEGTGNQWDWESGALELHTKDRTLSANGRGSLFAGQTEEEHTEQLARLIWKANRGPCLVHTRWINLDEGLNVEFGPADYQRVMEGGDDRQDPED